MPVERFTNIDGRWLAIQTKRIMGVCPAPSGEGTELILGYPGNMGRIRIQETPEDVLARWVQVENVLELCNTMTDIFRETAETATATLDQDEADLRARLDFVKYMAEGMVRMSDAAREKNQKTIDTILASIRDKDPK